MNYTINKKYWNNRRVFVTGHTGFKGSWLCIYLSLLGAKVTGYSLKPKNKPNLFELANIKKLIKKSVIADIRNFNKLLYEYLNCKLFDNTTPPAKKTKLYLFQHCACSRSVSITISPAAGDLLLQHLPRQLLVLPFPPRCASVPVACAPAPTAEPVSEAAR